jgi:RNA polymerase sigma factor (sigma-70 family)
MPQDELAGALAGQPGAWDRLVRRFERLLRDVGRQHRMSPADLDDAMQNTWLRLFRRMHAIREPEALPGWLATTMRRECLRMIQRPVREVLLGDEPIADPEPAPDALGEMLAGERRDAVRRSLVALPARHRDLMFLLTDSLSYAEVSDRLGIPLGSIGPIRSRSLARLQRDEMLRRLCA